MKRAGWIALAVAIAIGAGAWIFWEHQAAITRAQLDARIAKSKALLAQISQLDDRESAASKALAAAMKGVDDAGQRRHDIGVSASPDEHAEALAAHEEHRDVKAGQAAFDRQTDLLNQEADAYAAAYGDDSVAKLRARIDRYHETEQIMLNNLEAAVSDVDDEYIASENGTTAHSDDTTIQDYYQKAADGQVRGETQVGDVYSELTVLYNRQIADLRQEARERGIASE